MPELPEVESLRRELERTLVGRTIARVEVDLPKLFVPGDGLALNDLDGANVVGLRRRGKLLIWDLAHGASGHPDAEPSEAEGSVRSARRVNRKDSSPEPALSAAEGAQNDKLSLVFHLKLDGQLVHISAEGAELAHGGHPVPKWGTPLPHKATHVVFHLDDRSVLYLTDIRQFGRLWLMPVADVEAFVRKQRLSPEPLTAKFTAQRLQERLGRRSLPIKTVLLDQSVVSGIGNIYADEALWRARINPKRPANSLDAAEVRRLHRAIRWVLDYAVREGVAFVPRGKAISDRDFPYAHGRGGSPCPRCRTTIVKEWVGGRGTSYCPKCQRESSAVSRRSSVRVDRRSQTAD
jgi:formamidopyrimidine-DNA glycosylase